MRNVVLFVALASMFGNRKLRHDVAMTGEISLRGLVLPVGGIKDKVLAAQRASVGTVLLPSSRVRRTWTMTMRRPEMTAGADSRHERGRAIGRRKPR